MNMTLALFSFVQAPVSRITVSNVCRFSHLELCYARRRRCGHRGDYMPVMAGSANVQCVDAMAMRREQPLSGRMLIDEKNAVQEAWQA